MHQKSIKVVIIGRVKILVKNESYFSNGCHGLMQKAVSFNDVAIVYVKGSAYRICFWYISKDYAIHKMNNFYYIQKMSEKNYYPKNNNVILNRANSYYKNNKERLREQARDKYRNISDEKKNEKRSMEKTDIIICLKKKHKNQKNIKKIIVRLKSLDLIINIYVI